MRGLGKELRGKEREEKREKEESECIRARERELGSKRRELVCG